MQRNEPRTVRDARRAAPVLGFCLALFAVGCTSTKRVEVASSPPGARILINGTDSGQKTPSSLVLSTQEKRYAISIEKTGFNPVTREVTLTKDVDVMGPKEAVQNICFAPCCCGLSLLNLLDPVDIETTFVPSRIDATLEVAGQGARLEVTPAQFEAYLDGKLAAVLEGNYLVTSPGDHDLEVRAEGHRGYSRAIHVDERTYQRLKIELELEGQGLLLRGTPAGARCYLDDQYQGNLGDLARRVRADAGPHMLRVELDGYHTWQDVVQIAPDRYQELTLDLKLEGQGVIVRKPVELPAKTPEIQVLVAGQLVASAFNAPVRLEPGDHEVEIRVTGREPRTVMVRVTKDSYLDLEPGPKADGRTKQVRVARTGIRVVAPPNLVGIPERDIEIYVGKALAGYGFDRPVDVPAGELDLMVSVRGFRPWFQRLRVTSGDVLDVHPQFIKE